jgi:FMN phosphatase YigB (HAD superfamily)
MTPSNGIAIKPWSTSEAPKVIWWDLWGTIARSDNREPILHLQRILKLHTDTIDLRNIKSVDPDFLKVCLTTNIPHPNRKGEQDPVGFLRAVARPFNLSVEPEMVPEFSEVTHKESQCVLLFVDSRKVLKKLKAAGFNHGLISNLWGFPVKALFDEESLGKFIPEELRVYSFEEGYAKPDIRLFRRACERAGVKPEDCLMIGDHLENDILPARELGMRTVLIDREHVYSPEEVPADTLHIDKMETLLDYLPVDPNV